MEYYNFFVGSFGLDFVLTEAVFWIPVAVTLTFFPLPIFLVFILVSFSVVNTICSLYIHRSVQRAK